MSAVPLGAETNADVAQTGWYTEGKYLLLITSCGCATFNVWLQSF